MLQVKDPELHRILHEQRSELVAAWRHVLLTTNCMASATTVQQDMDALAGQIINTLAMDTIDREADQAVGVALARLPYIRPAHLGVLLDQLACWAVDVLHDRMCECAFRIMVLQAAIASGFVEQTSQVILASQERIRQALCAARLQSEAALQTREEQIRVILNYVPVILFAMNPHGILTLAEGKHLATFGIFARDVVGQSVFVVFQNYPDILKHIEFALMGITFAAFVEIADTLFQTYYVPHYQTDGALAGIIVLALDSEAGMRFTIGPPAAARDTAGRPACDQTCQPGATAPPRTDLSSRLAQVHQAFHGMMAQHTQHVAEITTALDDMRQTLQAAPHTGAEPHPQPAQLSDVPLTGREKEVLDLLVVGLRNHEISTLLGISRKTVEKHIANLYTKLGVRSRAGAIGWAVRH